MRRTTLKLLLILALAIAVPALALERATEGVITRVDSAAKTIAVKTADGTEEVFRFTKQTTIRAANGTKTAAVDTYLAGKEGTHVVVHYTGEGADKSAVGVDDFGNDTVRVAKGTVTDFDNTTHIVTVKTEDGSEQTYHVAKDATIDTEHGAINGTEYVAKKGENVTVHYTEEAGSKVAHFVRKL